MVDYSKEWETATPMSLDDEWETATPIETPEPTQKPGYFDRMGESIKKRYNKFTQYADYELDKKYKTHTGPAKVIKPSADLLTPNIKPVSVQEQIRDIGAVGLNVVGQVAGTLFEDIGVETINTVINEGTKKYTPKLRSELATTFKILAESKAGKEALQAINDVGSITKEWAEQHPGEAMYVNSAMNLVGAAGLKALTKKLSKQLMKETDELMRYAKPKPGEPYPKVEMPIEKAILKDKAQIDNVIKEGFYKGVKPSVAGKKTFKFTGDYLEDGKNSVISVLKRTDKVPQNLEDFSEAIYKTKKRIWDEVKTVSSEATQKGIEVDISNVIKNMEEAVSGYLTSPHPSEATRLKRIISNLKKKYPDNKMSPDEVEKMVSQYNAASKAWWANRNANDITAATSNAGIANDLRESLFNAIPDSEVYKTLRKEYGSLSAIEKDISFRNIVNSRRNVKGFFDLVDLWGTGELAAGIATMSPLNIVRGASHKILTGVTKHINDPNTHIKNMFKDAEKRLIKSGEIPARNRFIKRERPISETSTANIGRKVTVENTVAEKLGIKFDQKYESIKGRIIFQWTDIDPKSPSYKATFSTASSDKQTVEKALLDKRKEFESYGKK